MLTDQTLAREVYPVVGIRSEKLTHSILAQYGLQEEMVGAREGGPQSREFTEVCVSLNELARKGKLDPVIGRDRETKRAMQILGRRRKNNPVLIGDAGVGKTAIAEGIAQSIVKRTCPPQLLDKEIFLWDVTSLVSNTVFRGQLEGRLKANEIEKDSHTPGYEKTRLDALPPELRRLPFTVYGHRLLWLDEAALHESRKILLKVATRRRRKNQRWAVVRFYEQHIEGVLKARFWEHEKRKYLADGGVAELWEDHQKTIRYHPLELDKTDLESCLNFLVNAGISIADRQSGEIWALAQSHGWKPNNPEANRSIPANIPCPEPLTTTNET